jgi:hypothetical protein
MVSKVAYVATVLEAISIVIICDMYAKPALAVSI